MNHLHAHWRMEYVAAPKDSKGGADTFSCMYGENNDEENLILHRGPHTFIIMNKYPYNAGHLLVLPNRQVAQLEDLSCEERTETMERIMHAKAILSQALNPHGFNVGFNLGHSGGAGIPEHLHAHVVPRWDGDTNFMPVLNETRVLPVSLQTLFKRMKPFVESTDTV